MSSEQAIAIYEAIAATTGEMLDAARQNDWERLGELESRCPDLLHRLKLDPDTPLADGVRERIVALIGQALDNHRAIREAVSLQMDQLSKLIGSVHTERKLSSAYFPSISRE